jgi:hypothetical protein
MTDTLPHADPEQPDAGDLDDSLRAENPQIQDFDAYFADERELAARAARAPRAAAEGEEIVIDSVAFSFDPAEGPIATGTRCFAKEQAHADRFFVGSSVKFRNMKGLGIVAGGTSLLNSPKFNRLVEEERLGLWAHFMAPTVAAESFGGLHLLVNSYDRAAFTFGFYQLAAHTPNENLILLFRALLGLRNAKAYFPDLALSADGRVTQQTTGGPKNLEREVQVTLANGSRETQIPDFMAYLNPSVSRTDIREVSNAAKIIHWVRRDPAAMNASVLVPFEIMRKKIQRFTPVFGLAGKEPELAIWVSDLKHHGRGGRGVNDKISAALREPSLDKKLAALSRIDNFDADHPQGVFKERRNTVETLINKLRSENRFAGVKFAEGPLSFMADA